MRPLISQQGGGTQHAEFIDQLEKYARRKEAIRGGLTLAFVQTADKTNRQQAAYSKQKNDDNHGLKGLALQ
jgi:hypothetical protein